MPGPRRSGPTPPPPGGGQGRWRPARGYLALALIVGAGVPAYWLLSASAPTPDAAPAPADARVAAAVPTAPAPEAVPARVAITAVPVRTAVAVPAPPPLPAPPRIVRTRDPDGDPTPDLADYVNPGEQPTMAEVIERLHAAGVYSGLGAFQPPGTRPPLIGLAVPEDFELPPGYVRHHQATDDGQRIEAILMFSPDVQWVDAAGQPVAIPPDRVVPPELAPPGLPIRHIVVPAPIEPGK